MKNSIQHKCLILDFLVPAYFQLKDAIKQVSVGMQVIAAQLLQLRRAHQSLAKHVDSSCRSQDHFAHPLAYVQMRSHQMMHA
jgi:hypothetical protein